MTPLKKALAGTFRSRVQAVGLVTPLLAFILASFVFPILALMWQGVCNDRFESFAPNLTEQLSIWDGVSAPTEEMFAALATDLKIARKEKRLANRYSMNQELPGARSLYFIGSQSKRAKPLYSVQWLKLTKNGKSSKYGRL